MKKYMIIEKGLNGCYRYKEASGQEMLILSRFLTDDVGFYWDSFIDLISNENFQGGCSNSTCIDRDGDYIYLSDSCPAADNILPAKIRLQKQAYIDLLQHWKNSIEKNQPSEITLWYEGTQLFSKAQ